MGFQKVSSKVKARMAEMAKEKNMPQNLAEEITSVILEIIEQEEKQIEEEKTELGGYINCLEIYFDYREKINDAQRLRYLKLLKEKNELQARINTLEEEKVKSNLP